MRRPRPGSTARIVSRANRWATSPEPVESRSEPAMPTSGSGGQHRREPPRLHPKWRRRSEAPAAHRSIRVRQGSRRRCRRRGAAHRGCRLVDQCQLPALRARQAWKRAFPGRHRVADRCREEWKEDLALEVDESHPRRWPGQLVTGSFLNSSRTQEACAAALRAGSGSP